MTTDDTDCEKKIVVTGANGFIGKPLVARLRDSGHRVTGISRKIGQYTHWAADFEKADSIIHLAGLAHQRGKTIDNAAYFKINRDGTLHIATAAHAAGVKRFIFISSAKVFGEGGESIYRDASTPAPEDAYAQSKWQAEQMLMERFAHLMEIVILRPPLVYGCDAKANFAALLKLAKLPIPLPIANINNRRAMIGIDNLIDLITLCLTHPDAAGKTWLCADAQFYSLADIVIAIRRAMNREANVFRLPAPLLFALKKLLGNSVSKRLFDDFTMDCSETYRALNWKPPFTMEQILRGDARSKR
ncbi:MAG: NAD-dependent epimerase/dehydratase family protein [Spongiibacteraceae bacterium]